MKRLFLSTLCFVFIGFFLQAQSSGRLLYGAKAGINVSTFLGRDYLDITPRIGFYAGGLAEFQLTDALYFQPEAILSFQGADLGAGNLKLVYFHIPLMGKYHITNEIAVEVGPQLGILLSDNGEDFFIQDTAPTVDTKTVHLGLNVGAGYRLNPNIYFQARFSFGLSKVIKDTDTKNGLFQAGASYFF